MQSPPDAGRARRSGPAPHALTAAEAIKTEPTSRVGQWAAGGMVLGHLDPGAGNK